MILRILAMLALVFAGMNAHASTARESLQSFLMDVQTLSASFTQVQRNDDGQVLATSSGRMWLSRPGRFRWSYEKPYAQLMVCDGDRLWSYEADLAQVTVRSAKSVLVGTPAALLAQQTTLDASFRIVEGKAGSGVVRLLPKSPDSDFKSIELLMKNGVPQRMKFFDQLGGTSTVTFSRIETGQPLEDSLFRFRAPKGVEVIETDGAP